VASPAQKLDAEADNVNGADGIQVIIPGAPVASVKASRTPFSTYPLSACSLVTVAVVWSAYVRLNGGVPVKLILL
jgi:hypothetical protein